MSDEKTIGEIVTAEVPVDLVEQLSACVPHALPGLQESERSIYFRAGQQWVIQLLRELASKGDHEEEQ